jgi:hypothetical protein
VLYGDLEKAVKRESVEAICYWWGVGPYVVWHWRKALLGSIISSTDAAADFSVLCPRNVSIQGQLNPRS